MRAFSPPLTAAASRRGSSAASPTRACDGETGYDGCMAPRVRDPFQRLLTKISIDDNGCWIFIGAQRRNGSGVFKLRSRIVSPHRFVWEQLHKAQLGNKRLHHRCGNKSCLNPEHLYITEDEAAPVHRRKDHPRRKLSEEQLLRAKDMRKSGF